MTALAVVTAVAAVVLVACLVALRAIRRRRARRVSELQRLMDNLKADVNAQAVAVGTALLPAMTSVVAAMSDAARRINRPTE